MEDKYWDFWNHKINPIVGYRIKNLEEQTKETEKKYFKNTQSLKQ